MFSNHQIFSLFLAVWEVETFDFRLFYAIKSITPSKGVVKGTFKETGVLVTESLSVSTVLSTVGKMHNSANVRSGFFMCLSNESYPLREGRDDHNLSLTASAKTLTLSQSNVGLCLCTSVGGVCAIQCVYVHAQIC